MSFGSIMSRVLGIVYIIPWLWMIGSASNQNEAQAIFNAAYTPYALFIALGTAGFPTSIARQVAYYNSQNRFKNSLRIFKYGLLFMGLTGLVCGLLLWFFAPAIAQTSAVVSVDDTIIAIRVLVPTLIILPPMSFIRGFFQGNSDMKPFGVSQLWEQFMRVIFMLAATYVVIYLFKQSYVNAVYWSTFATFVGTLASYFYLFNYARKKLPDYRDLYAQSEPLEHTPIVALFKEIIHDALPFVFIGSGITLLQFIDQVSFKPIVVNLTAMPALSAQDLYTYFSANPNKITTVVVSLTIAVSETTLPLLVSSYNQKDKNKVSHVIAQNLELMFVTLLPVVIILGILSSEINGIFFHFSSLGASLLACAIVASVAQALFTDFFTLIQSMRKHRLAVKLLVAGILMKLALQVPMLYLFNAYGAIWSTFIAFALISLFVYIYLRKHYLKRGDMQNLLGIFLLNVFLAVGAFVLNGAIKEMIRVDTKLTAFIYCALFGSVMMLGYVICLSKLGLLKAIFGFDLPQRKIDLFARVAKNTPQTDATATNSDMGAAQSSYDLQQFVSDDTVDGYHTKDEFDDQYFDVGTRENPKTAQSAPKVRSYSRMRKYHQNKENNEDN